MSQARQARKDVAVCRGMQVNWGGAGLDASTGLLESLVLFRGLRELDLSRNRLAELPEVLLQLHGLTHLNLSRNCLTRSLLTHKQDSRAKLCADGGAAHVASLLGSNLQGAPLIAVPVHRVLLLSVCTTAAALHCLLCDNSAMAGSWIHLRCGSLPAGIGSLLCLEDLDLGRNELTRVPDELGALTQLRTLNLMANKLTSLPESLGKLTNVFRLGLKSNALTQVLSLPPHSCCAALSFRCPPAP